MGPHLPPIHPAPAQQDPNHESHGLKGLAGLGRKQIPCCIPAPPWGACGSEAVVRNGVGFPLPHLVTATTVSTDSKVQWGRSTWRQQWPSEGGRQGLSSGPDSPFLVSQAQPHPPLHGHHQKDWNLIFLPGPKVLARDWV